MDDIVAVPDPYFINQQAYRTVEDVWLSAPDWTDRDDKLIWRGSPNGAGLLAWDRQMLGASNLMPRCRLVLLCRGTEIDARFVIPGAHHESRLIPFFEAAGLLGPFKRPASWAAHRYALDIDGFSNSWDNFLTRLKLGCCVLKVDSPGGFRQWYYPRLSPWEHFVPIRSDLSDLFEKYDWVRSNPGRARDIAAAGRAVAAGMTLDSELAEGARLIEEHA
jgi:hypothetical protein